MISCTLYRRELVAANACQEGRALHAQIVAMQGRRHSVYVREWTPLHSVWLAVAHPGFASWLSERGLIPRANLYGANLTRANLYGANLYGANLTRADLCGANLYGASLCGASLSGANLCGASLYGADLTRANLYGANLTRADLCGANLYGAATLIVACLDSAYYPTGDVPTGWERDESGYLRRSP